jgi:hypothetical protein
MAAALALTGCGRRLSGIRSLFYLLKRLLQTKKNLQV